MQTKILVGVLIVAVLLIGIVFAHGEENFSEIKNLVNNKISCDKLSDKELEEIGEYYMEKMHPGEAHEMMDEMMGGKGSESLRLMHINMARMMYCNNGEGMNNMMNMMSGMMTEREMMSMMNGNMMNRQTPQTNMMDRMMNWNYGGMWGWNIFGWLFGILVIVAFVLLIIWLIKQIQKK